MTPVLVGMARQWRGLSRYVGQTLDEPGSTASRPLVNAQLIDTIAAVALTVFPNTTMRLGNVGRTLGAGPREDRTPWNR